MAETKLTMMATIRILTLVLVAGLASQAVAWPAVSQNVGKPGVWSSLYSRTKDAAKNARLPCMVVFVDSAESTANADWNEGTLEDPSWEDWVGNHQMYLVMLDLSATDGVTRPQWMSIANEFADKNGWIHLPQVVIFDPSGKKITQFCADGDLSEAAAFIERIECLVSGYPNVIIPGPGTVGFTSKAVTVRAGATVASMTVRRLGGNSEGRQVFTLETVALTNAGAAVAGVNYEPLVTNLVWEAGDAGERKVDVVLPNGEGWSQPVDRAFSVRLTRDPNSTAKIGTTNLTVTITSDFSATNGWWATTTNNLAGATNVLWCAGPFTNRTPATLTWVAPQPGLLMFSGWKASESTNDILSLRLSSMGTGIPTPGIDTNETVSAVNVIALAEGERVSWTASGTNGMFFVEMLGWHPLSAPVLTAPDNRRPFQLKDVVADPSLVDLRWQNAISGAWAYSVLFTGKTEAALSPAITNAPGSSVGAAGWGLTNGWYYWRVDNVATGDLKTVVSAQSPVWSFEVSERPVFTVAPSRVSFYLGVPSSFTVHADCVAPVSYSASGLATIGLAIDPATGLVSGTAKRKGTYSVTVKAASSKGEATLPVTVTVEPLSAYISGTLQGVVRDAAGTVRGVFTMTVAASGTPTLKMEVDGKRKTWRGKWQETSRVNALVANFSDRAASLDLTVSGDVARGRMAGGLDMEARRVLAMASAKPYAGYYTVLLDGVPMETGDLNNVPAGFGYLTFTVTERTGSVKYGGKLADGTSVSGSAGLMQGGVFPVYKPLYSKRGEAAALVALSQGVTNAVTAGNGAWLFPGKTKALTGDAFLLSLGGTGAEYVKKPVSLKWLDGMGLNVDGAGAAEINATDKKVTVVVNGDGVKLNVTASSGLFKGSFRDTATGKNQSFKGALVPAEMLGAGYWLQPDPSAAGYRLNRSKPVEIGAGGAP